MAIHAKSTFDELLIEKPKPTTPSEKLCVVSETGWEKVGYRGSCRSGERGIGRGGTRGGGSRGDGARGGGTLGGGTAGEGKLGVGDEDVDGHARGSGTDGRLSGKTGGIAGVWIGGICSTGRRALIGM